MQISRTLFFQIQEKLDTIPFNQSKEWIEHAYGDLPNESLFFVDSETEPHIACIGQFSQKKILGRRLIIDGISKSKTLTSDHVKNLFKGMVEDGYDAIWVSDVDEYDPTFEVGIRRAGLIRPLGLHLCPMSMIMELQQPFSFHRNWRRNVKKAMEHGCKFVVKDVPSKDDAKDFVRLFGELKERKKLGFTLTAERIMTLLEGNYHLFFIENSEGKNICGRISYTNSNLVYDVYAANSDEAISVGAAYLIQESIFHFYKENGFDKFDYGRISPSADNMDNIYVAKSYSGGRPVGYNGEWTYYNKLWKQYFYSIYRFVYCHSRLY